MTTGKYHYRECGLEDVNLRNGFRHAETPHGRVVQIADIDGLHRAIGGALVRGRKRLTRTERRFLRHELGLSQDMLGALIGKSGQTVARWEKTEPSRIDEAAERMLRFLYLEHIGGNDGVRGLIEALSGLEDRIGGELDFEATDEGWQPCSEAA